MTWTRSRAFVSCANACRTLPHSRQREPHNRGNTYADLESYDLALADYGRAIELNPEYASAFYNTACAYASMEKVEDACAWLEKTIALDEKYRVMARDDADFDGIRAEARFRTLVGE